MLGEERTFNAEYLAMVRHFGMEARTIAVGKKEQNGDVEAGHRALKRRLEQALLVRGSRDFADQDEYQAFVDGVVRKANAGRGPRVAEELEAMRPLVVERLPEYSELPVPVASTSTIRVKSCAYSVPSRLIGERVRVRIFEHRIEVYYADKLELSCERLRGKSVRIDYHHVIWSLVRKPGAFARYVYREELFPTVIFRRAYDAIQATRPGIKGDVEYLRILHLAASTIEAEVEQALMVLLTEGAMVTAEAVKKKTAQTADGLTVPELEAPAVDLTTYDALLMGVA